MNLIPALPAEAIIQGLRDVGFCERNIRALLEQTEFTEISFPLHRLCFLRDWARDVLDQCLSSKKLSIAVQINERTGRKNLRRGPQESSPLGRHHALAEDREPTLMRIVVETYHDNQAMTRRQLLNLVRERFNPAMTKGWIITFVGTQMDALRPCRSLPQEDVRLMVPRVQLEEYITTVKAHLAGKCAELVFNLDELGSADWEDRKIRKVIAPASVAKEDVFHPVSRREHHMTLLACVSAAGNALTPLVIRATQITPSLWSPDVRQDEDAMIRHRIPAYVDEGLFYADICNVVAPYVVSGRTRPELERETAVILMDSALPHVSERVLRTLGENSILVPTFPAHATNLFQALDLVFFGALKKLKATAIAGLDDKSANEKIMTFIQAHEQTATSATIRGSFRKAGRHTTHVPRKLSFLTETVITSTFELSGVKMLERPQGRAKTTN
jgi:hypothetical protein